MKNILYTFLLFCVISTQSFSQWYWQNPRPHGNANNRIAFSSVNTFTIVGNSGTIIRTTNNGASWKVQDAGTDVHLRDIHFFTANEGIIVGRGGTVLRTTDGGENWTAINIGRTTNLEGVSFSSPAFGIIVGWNGLILRTSNGGLDWDSIPTPNGTTQKLFSVSYATASNALVVGDGGTIFRTADGGITWNLQTSGTVQSLYDVAYVNSSVAFACGWGGTVIKTTNGGSSWASAGFFSWIRWGISFTSANHGVVVGDQNTMNITTDGGETWEISNTGTQMSTNFHSVRFYNSTKGIAVGEYGAIFQTNDGGVTWQILTKGSVKLTVFPNMVYRNNFYSVHCFSPSGAAIVSVSDVFITNNNGATWRYSWIENYPFLNDLHFFSSSYGFVVGTNSSQQGSSIFRTNNGGNSWSTVYSSSSTKLLNIHFSTPNHGVAVGEFGKILVTFDGGQTWNEPSIVPTGVNHLYDVFLVDSLRGYAVGRFAYILKTTDGGLTWSTQLSNAFFSLNGVAFTSPTNGIAVGDSVSVGISHGIILKTTDGGINWSRQVLDTPLSLNSVSFTNNPNICYAVGTTNILGVVSGRIFKSGDGGNSWIEQITEPRISRNLVRVSAYDEDNRMIAGYHGAIIGSKEYLTVSGSQSNLNIPINHLNPAAIAIHVNPPQNLPKRNFIPTVESIEISIDEVLHTRTGDLTFTVEHNGVVDTIIFEVGGDGQNFISTRLSDDAETPIEGGTAPFTGVFKPTKPLSVFNGLDPYGEWLFTIEDNYPGNDGILNALSIFITINTAVVGVDDNAIIPEEFALYQNYPNPFNPSTNLSFVISQWSVVTLKIYDLLGREVATLVNEEKPAGHYKVTFDASRLASGVYFYQLRATPAGGQAGNQFVETKKMVLIR